MRATHMSFQLCTSWTWNKLFGYGASAINPYMVNEIIEYHHKLGFLNEQKLDKSIDNFNKAIAKGILKVMNKFAQVISN